MLRRLGNHIIREVDEGCFNATVDASSLSHKGKLERSRCHDTLVYRNIVGKK